jgi:hypothetical protein
MTGAMNLTSIWTWWPATASHTASTAGPWACTAGGREPAEVQAFQDPPHPESLMVMSW